MITYPCFLFQCRQFLEQALDCLHTTTHKIHTLCCLDSCWCVYFLIMLFFHDNNLVFFYRVWIHMMYLSIMSGLLYIRHMSSLVPVKHLGKIYIYQNHDDITSNVNIFRITGPLCGGFPGHRWIPLTKASDTELWCSLWSAWINGSVNNGEAGDLRCHSAHYDVTVMQCRTTHISLPDRPRLLYIGALSFPRLTNTIYLPYMTTSLNRNMFLFGNTHLKLLLCRQTN